MEKDILDLAREKMDNAVDALRRELGSIRDRKSTRLNSSHT